MSMQEYLDHYFEMPDFAIFMAIAAAAILLSCVILDVASKMGSTGKRGRGNGFDSLMERFFELIFSGTSILFFMASYYMIERFLEVEPYRSFWDDYKDFLLLLLIVTSCICTTIFDRVLVRFKHISHEERASIRLIGMLYMVLIFAYIKYIYENNNYDVFITYFLGLMVGRFVYFDASFRDFARTLSAAVKNIPLMFLALACTAGLSWYGFTTKYLIKHIGVVTNVFFIHLFFCVAIFVIFHLREIYLWVTRSGKR